MRNKVPLAIPSTRLMLGYVALSLALSGCGATSFDTYAPVLRIRPPEAPDRTNTAAQIPDAAGQTNGTPS